MPYTFRSRSAGPVTLRGGAGRHVLQLIGKSPRAYGILPSEELSRAIRLLAAALERDDALRATALVELMVCSQRSGDDITWDTPPWRLEASLDD